VEASIDAKRRKLIERNHTATHLLHWALQKILGEHVKQAGSIVAPDRLRFDFSHHKGVTKDELRWIEDLVNEQVAQNTPVETYELSYAEAQKRSDIKQFFGEKYGERVRVVDVDVSKELCGGCHVNATGDVGTFRIASESSIAAGVRRIVAVTGQEALQISRRQEDMLEELAALLKTQPAKLLERASHLQEENTHYAKEMAEARKGQLKALAAELVDEVEELQGLPYIGKAVDVEVGQLRDLADLVMEQLKTGVIALGAVGEGNCAIAARVSDDLVKQGVAAGALVKLSAPLMGGGGGGKPAAAQAGGKQPEKLGEALQAVRQALLER
jgi:alanyl-tRNA synthetase